MQRSTKRRTFVLRWSIAVFSAVTALAAQDARGFFAAAGERVRAVEERYQDYWSSHLQNSRRRILRAAELTKNRGRAVVLGAGECREIPLEELARRFEQVVLVDLDRGSLEEAAEDLSPELQAKLELQVSDLTSFAIPMMRGIEEAVEASQTIEQAFGRLSEVYAKALGEHDLPRFPRADLVISSLVASELHRYPGRYAGRLLRRKFQAGLAGWDGHEQADRRLQLFALNEHAALIASLLRTGGIVYISDTVARGPFDPESKRILRPEIAAKLAPELARRGVFEAILGDKAATRTFAGAYRAIRGIASETAGREQAAALLGDLTAQSFAASRSPVSRSPVSGADSAVAAAAVVNMLCLDRFPAATEAFILESLMEIYDRSAIGALEPLLPLDDIESAWKSQQLRMVGRPRSWWWLGYPCNIPRNWGAFKIQSWILIQANEHN